MKRRVFIGGIGSAALIASPLLARAETSRPVIGFLNSESPGTYARPLAAFHKGLEESGYVEGRNVTIEYRWGDGHYDRLAAMAAELVRRKVDAIFANGPTTLFAKALTSTIPIVFSAGFDPVEAGFVASLARPGGNVTGASILNVAVGQKRVELMHDCVPTAMDVGALVNPGNPNAEAISRDVQSAAQTLRLKIHLLQASDESDLETVFASLKQIGVGALVIGGDPFFNSHAEKLAALALAHRMPTIYQYREFVAAGGLMSYGGSIADAYRWGGIYVGRILSGANPANLPVQQSTIFELIINLNTAKALGVTVPPALLARADEVIE